MYNCTINSIRFWWQEFRKDKWPVQGDTECQGLLFGILASFLLKQMSFLPSNIAIILKNKMLSMQSKSLK